MSETPLFPEDVLSARFSLRFAAAEAKELADEEARRAREREIEDLLSAIWDFMGELGVPDHALQDLDYTTGQLGARPAVFWVIDGIKFRASFTMSWEPQFEAQQAGSFATTYKKFTDLASLGRVIAGA